ncbi:CIC11C00000000055 [Sungouiella intermedia]|uniref:CIC11C00000000055 n=1 Tax=Sungouiella intermedia TaxID=45354 RepID=A0A1L0BUL7_9ASCO|nr:CIC11C00000000055 [[Candida] intermedia]
MRAKKKKIQTIPSHVRLGLLSHPAVVKIQDKYWFHEFSEDAFPGQTFGLEIKEILHHSKSEFQDILIFKSTSFGNVLVLNGIVQCTEKDEFSYQELIAHVPIMSHPDPKKVLVIGGGDCGVVRELVKHTENGSVASITMVEIDQLVIDLSVRYLPDMAKHHNHPKVKIEIDDGFQFLQKLELVDEADKYDVIITDSSDPEGPAEEFFEVNYFKLLKNAVKKDGIVIMQSSENIWLNINYLGELVQKAKKVFSNVEYCQCYMPSYTSGQLGLIVATCDESKNLKKPLRRLDEDEEAEMFRYYSGEVHEAAFVLPTWAKKIVR